MLNNFRVLTSGESHGKCLNAIIDGIPAGFEVDIQKINKDLQKRQQGPGRSNRMKIEFDQVEIKSGVRFGLTTGAPICVEVENKDYQNWKNILSTSPENIDNPEIQEQIKEKAFTKVRPGHADFAGAIKYNAKDLRDILERSSARKTAIDVAVGSIAKQILENFQIKIESKILQIATETKEEKFTDIIEFAKNQGDSVGGKFEITVKNPPIGLGSFVQWDRKLDGLLAQAIMSIPGIKSFEIGAGIHAADLFGSQMHDEIFTENNSYYRKTNNAGGIEGGMTNGENIVIKTSMKAIPTIKKPLATIDIKDYTQCEAHFERADACAVYPCAIVAESMVAWVISDAFLDKFGKDNFEEIKDNFSRRKK